jgi:SAM-dependent methyltransferase
MNAPRDWYARFFEGLAVDFWRVVVPEAATAEEAAFLWKHLALSAGDRVLDVPCGHGRLALPLAARGCAVTGVDLSREFLRAAEDASRGAGVSVAWRRSDMRTLPWRGSFDAAFCMGNSFGYLDDAGNAAFLAAVARALVPRGRFVLDFGQAAESIFPRLEPQRRPATTSPPRASRTSTRSPGAENPRESSPRSASTWRATSGGSSKRRASKSSRPSAPPPESRTRSARSGC